jgi:hypothetical protein
MTPIFDPNRSSKLSLLCLLICGVLLPGCSVNIKKPNNRFVTPEVSGDLWKGKFGAYLTGSTNIQVVENKFNDAPNTDPELEQSSDFGLELGLGITPRLDLYYSANFVGPGVGGVKFQLLGDNLASSKAGNFSLTPFAGWMWGGFSSETTSGEETAKSSVRLSGLEAGISLGYRVKELVLPYLTVFYSRLLGDTIVDQEENGVSRKGVVDIGGEGEFKTAAIGVVFGKRIFFQIEACYTEATWRRTHPTEIGADKLGVGYGGLNTGFNW